MSGIYDFTPQLQQSGFGQPQQASYFPSVDPTRMGAQATPGMAAFGNLSELQSFNQPSGQFNLATAGVGGGVTPAGSGGGFTDWLGKSGNLNTIFGGIQALGSAYLGFQQLKQAKDALAFQKQAYGTNLANSEQTYNTSLEDRINGRTSDYAGKDADVQAYLKDHKL